MLRWTPRIRTALLLAGGGALLGFLGLRHVAQERERTAELARRLEQRHLAEAVAAAPGLALHPRSAPLAAWQVEPATLTGSDELADAALLGALERARAATADPASALTRWRELAAPGRPAWARHIASFRGGLLALSLRRADLGREMLRVALDAHVLLVSEGVRVRAGALKALALAGLRDGDAGALARFLDATLDGKRLARGEVVGPADLVVELAADVRREDLRVPAAAAERLQAASARAAEGLALMAAVPRRGSAALAGARVALHGEIALEVRDLASLVAPPPGYPATLRAELASADGVLGPRSARLPAPFDAVVVTVPRAPLRPEGLLALLGLALGLGLYGVGAVMALRGWRRSREAARMQADFTAAVSHEMKTPIASVRAMAELLGDDPELAARYAGRIEGEMQRLGATIRNVLDAAQIERESLPVHPQPGDPAALVLRSADALRPGLVRRGFALAVEAADAARPVALDADAVGGVLMNLVDNAAKFSDERKEIRLEGESVEDGYLIRVLDRGIGLDPSQQARLFERFYRGHAARERAVPGVGLGLHIARQVIHALGGRLTARNRAGGGAAFEIHLPAWKTP